MWHSYATRYNLVSQYKTKSKFLLWQNNENKKKTKKNGGSTTITCRTNTLIYLYRSLKKSVCVWYPLA